MFDQVVRRLAATLVATPALLTLPAMTLPASALAQAPPGRPMSAPARVTAYVAPFRALPVFPISTTTRGPVRVRPAAVPDRSSGWVGSLAGRPTPATASSRPARASSEMSARPMRALPKTPARPARALAATPARPVRLRPGPAAAPAASTRLRTAPTAGQVAALRARPARPAPVTVRPAAHPAAASGSAAQRPAAASGSAAQRPAAAQAVAAGARPGQAQAHVPEAQTMVVRRPVAAHQVTDRSAATRIPPVRTVAAAAPAQPASAQIPSRDLMIDVVTMTNQQRAAAGCPPLTIEHDLIVASLRQSWYMARTGTFTHVWRNGSTFVTRSRAAGYRQPAAENIAWGYATAAEVMDAWMDSPGHRANILNCGTRSIGTGVAYAANGTPYYTQVFGWR